MDDISGLRAELRLERIHRRRWEVTAFALWLLSSMLAAGWIEEYKGEQFHILNFALQTLAMLWAVGLAVMLAMLLAVVLFERR